VDKDVRRPCDRPAFLIRKIIGCYKFLMNLGTFVLEFVLSISISSYLLLL
jgi:hypothetical protein